MTNGEALEKSRLRKQWIALEANPAFREYKDKLDQAFTDHSAGLSDRKKTPSERAEHIEAYHLAKDLREILPARIKALTSELEAWEKTQLDSPMGLLDEG